MKSGTIHEKLHPPPKFNIEPENDGNSKFGSSPFTGTVVIFRCTINLDGVGVSDVPSPFCSVKDQGEDVSYLSKL